jgi:MarR family multiple antibiotic resistance transcriptional regulator
MTPRARPAPENSERREPAIGADRAAGVRAELHRTTLTDARQRAALARHLGVTQTDVLAIHHVARAGQLTPSELGALLGLSSAGTTAVIRRLKQAGHITRRAHANDARSVVLRLIPEIAASTTEAWAPYTTELDAIIGALAEPDRALVAAFLRRVADAAQRHADQLARDRDAATRDALAVELPTLWA